MPEAGLLSRIMSHREIMISLAGLCLVLLTLLLGRVNSAVLLLTDTKESWSFPDMEASFGKSVLQFLTQPCLPLVVVPLDSASHQRSEMKLSAWIGNQPIDGSAKISVRWTVYDTNMREDLAHSAP